MNGRRLYEEIGYVDERYLQEAAVYRARKKASAWRPLLIAAAIMLSVTLLLGTLAAGTVIGVILTLGEGNEQEQPESMTALQQMEQTMADCALTPLSEDELELFDAPVLIWREQGSDAYYSVTLSQYECDMLAYLMQSRRHECTDQSQAPAYQIWICFGDGVVVSPYLKNTAGNTSHGAVFDYDPELEMSDALAKYIAECIGT